MIFITIWPSEGPELYEEEGTPRSTKQKEAVSIQNGILKLLKENHCEGTKINNGNTANIMVKESTIEITIVTSLFANYNDY